MPSQFFVRSLALASLISLGLQGCAPVLVGAGATGALIATDRRTTGTVIDDNSITITAEHALIGESTLEGGHINVTTYNGRVLLTGEVPHDAMRKEAERIVRQDGRVKDIHNELAISAPSSIVARTSDTLISARIKAALVGLDIEGFNPTDVSVTTERGIVYLMGFVTQAEGDAVTEVVRTTSGVQKVVRIFEYQPARPSR